MATRVKVDGTGVTLTQRLGLRLVFPLDQDEIGAVCGLHRQSWRLIFQGGNPRILGEDSPVFKSEEGNNSVVKMPSSRRKRSLRDQGIV